MTNKDMVKIRFNPSYKWEQRLAELSQIGAEFLAAKRSFATTDSDGVADKVFSADRRVCRRVRTKEGGLENGDF